jgi:enoyl-CoA hydratase/carnithine racemase
MIDKHIRNMLDEFKKREFMVLEDQEAKDAIQEELYDAIEEIIDKWIADPLSYEHKLPSEVRD